MRIGRLAAGAAMIALLAGCSSDSSTPAESSPAATEVTIFAAASLKATFTELGTQFEAAHPGTTVKFNFAGSSDLVAQLQQGAPADAFASADEANMDKAADADLLAAEPVIFATNSMIIAVPPDNPANITEWDDLANDDVQVVVCAPEVPCGAATVRVEENTGVELQPVSEEDSVTDVLNKVATGEADAGIVYITDVQAAGDSVEGIEIPAKGNAVNSYPIAVVANSTQAELAQEFQDLVVGPEGQKVMAEAGFGAP